MFLPFLREFLLFIDKNIEYSIMVYKFHLFGCVR
jgi:hypothetical protein